MNKALVSRYAIILHKYLLLPAGTDRNKEDENSEQKTRSYQAKFLLADFRFFSPFSEKYLNFTS